MVSAEEIINEFRKKKPNTRLRTNPKITGVSIDTLKELKIRDIRKLTKEYKSMKGGF